MSGIQFGCQYCDKQFDDVSDCLQHMETHKKETDTCEYCGGSWSDHKPNCNTKIKILISDEQQIVDQMIRAFPQSGVKLFKCDECDHKFYHNLHLAKHKESGLCSKTTDRVSFTSHVSNGKEQYKCEHCCKTFDQKDLLEGHAYLHSGVKLHECKGCKRGFNCKNHLKKHQCPLKSAQGWSGKEYKCEYLYKCGQCDEAFNMKTEFVAHISSHNVGKYLDESYNWEFDESFSMKVDLEELDSFQISTESYTCENCNKSFDKKSILDEHYCSTSFSNDANFTEPGYEPNRNIVYQSYKCDYCDKSFPRMPDLEGRVSIHVCMKNFKCEGCNKSFNKKSDLYEHVCSKPYFCDSSLAGHDSESNRNKDRGFEMSIPQDTYNKVADIEKPAEHYDESSTSKPDFAEDNSLSKSEKLYESECSDDNHEHVPTDIYTKPVTFNLRAELEDSLYINTVVELYKCGSCDESFYFKSHKDKHACTKICPNNSNLAEHDSVSKENESYKCFYCEKSFPKKSHLKLDDELRDICRSCSKSRKRTSEKAQISFKCDQCDKSFSRKGVLKNHILTHKKDKPFICEYCSKSFKSSSGLDVHVRFHTGDKPYECEYCYKSFPTKHYLENHTRTHTGEGQLKRLSKCEHCEKMFYSKTAKEQHQRNHTGERPYKCGNCDKAWSYKSGLTNHIQLFSGKNPHKCEHCDNKYCQKLDLIKHMKVHNNGKRFKCDLCNKPFKTNKELIRHIRIHTGEKPYKCDYCGQSFSQKGSLDRHMPMHTAHKRYKCEHCDESFNLKSKLVEHEIIHTGEKPKKSNNKVTQKNKLSKNKKGKVLHWCKFCKKSFTNFSNLKTHRQKFHGEANNSTVNIEQDHENLTANVDSFHTVDRPFKCEYCDKLFSIKSNLTIHTRKHTGERPHKCEHCEKSFFSKAEKKNHLRIHTGERQYECENCDKSFFFKSGLLKHLRAQTGDSTFNCEYCDNRFCLKSDLIKHKRVHTVH